MKVELPEFKRCCCCIPLRYGLLAWGYIKLIITLLILIFITLTLSLYIRIMMIRCMNELLPEIVTAVVFDMIILLDIALTIVFLVGGHRKSARLLEVFYIYNVVFLCISTILFILSTTLELYYIGHYTSTLNEGYISFGFVAQTKLITGLANIGTQVYITLLIRSEINKLRNNSNFRFANTATEAKYALENGTTDPVNGTDDHTSGTNEHENKIDELFEDIIGQSKATHCETFSNYTKL